MAGILIYSEKTGLALELLTAARELAAHNKADIKALAINNGEQAGELTRCGAACCQVMNGEINSVDSAVIADVLSQAVKILNVDTVLLSSDRRGKEVAGRLAQALDAGCLSDVKSFKMVNDRVAWVRNALGGATVSTQVIKSLYKVIAVSPRAFTPAGQADGGSLQDLEIKARPSQIKLVGSKAKSGESVDIEAASTLVVVGQGLENKDDLPLVEKISQALGGEVACSKPVATDKKWFDEDRIIGLSGKTCKPELALILGVSGQVQFTVGIRDAKTIVSINSDENAGMNQMADYVLVGDLKNILPELSAALA